MGWLAGRTLGTDSCCTATLSGSSQGTAVREDPPAGRASAAHPDIHRMWKEKQPEVRAYQKHAQGQMV